MELLKGKKLIIVANFNILQTWNYALYIQEAGIINKRSA
jgi:hypothetical protein